MDDINTGLRTDVQDLCSGQRADKRRGENGACTFDIRWRCRLIPETRANVKVYSHAQFPSGSYPLLDHQRRTLHSETSSIREDHRCI